MILLINTIFKLAKKIKKDLYFYLVFSFGLLSMILFTIFIPSFAWISLILIIFGLILGITKIAINKSEGERK